jgi:Spy/CpxP family protein refolding chaperone
MQWQMAIALGVVLVAASAAQAQRQGGRRGFRGGDPMLSVLRIDEVLKEVEVTDEQKAEISKILDEARGERTDFGSLRDLSDEEREKKLAELREASQKRSAEAKAKLEKALLPQQVKRLKELAVQSQGLRALTTAEVQAELKLSDMQKEQIAAAYEKSGEKMRELFQGAGENREGLREKMETLRKETDESVLSALTAEQKAQFETLKGEAFEFPERQRGGGDRRRERPEI